jgi:acetolactate synthase-1/2/3 large subunit
MVVGNASPCIASSQCGIVHEGFRFIMNSGAAQMGYGLPAAIGACVGNDLNEVYCVTGDGSIQMNIQELQTVITNKFNIKLFIINNEGYHSIRQTQTNYFDSNYVGIGPDSGDLSFPDFSKLANAYGFKYYSLKNSSDMNKQLVSIMEEKGPYICEVFVTKEQKFEPKPASRKLPDGTMVSAPLEDMYPFLDREELKQNMYIKLIDE